jgi:hypothetical protein
MPICERHWADCNGDPTDGCETATTHPLYCDGDPRIEAAREPVIGFSPSGDPRGPGTFSAAALSRALGRWKPELARCYREVLADVPGVAGLVSYEITIDAGGCLKTRFARSTTHNPRLDHCVQEFLNRVRLSSAPESGEVTRMWDVVFYAGEAQTQGQ